MSRKSSDDESFSGLAFKIMTDPYVGSLTFVRIYSGVLEVGASCWPVPALLPCFPAALLPALLPVPPALAAKPAAVMTLCLWRAGQREGWLGLHVHAVCSRWVRPSLA